MCRDERWQNMSKIIFHVNILDSSRKLYMHEKVMKKKLCQQSKKRSDVDIGALRSENMAWNMRLDGEAVRLISESFPRF